MENEIKCECEEDFITYDPINKDIEFLYINYY